MRPAQDASAAPAAARGAAELKFSFDPGLPITARREEIRELLRTHPVIIVAGDTGSGKSTQLPQYCLELGRGLSGMIAHTQPRRIAARALATRVAGELGQELGATVGFRVRFADRVSAATRLVLMTDGLLLAELAADPLLRRYDTLIVDEAHERTINIDLLLGVIKGLLRRRTDLKVIVTSATLEVERVSRFFDGAPVLTVAGRAHPVEVRYLAEEGVAADEFDLPAAILEAHREIETEPGQISAGDVLVFLPGEREIRDVGEFLDRELTDIDVVPLYSRLDWEQQARIFERGRRRRVVLATNVAETSITVPGIRAVIDSGLARVSRYSVRNRLQRLPIESISQASAEQRKGRCGRLGAGLCLRLYTEADFLSRPAQTEPEILRTNLAALLLRLAADGLGAAEDFPFIDAPDGRALNDGYRLLQELGALDSERLITRRGRAMARLPLDPRLARALLESKRFHAEADLMAICAGLSVPDARIVTAGPIAPDSEDSAEAAAFDDPRSEFSALVKLWRAYRRARDGSRRELRRWCKERRLSLLRLSEWDNVHAQVKDRAADIGIVATAHGASYTAVHRSLLAGFCTMVGLRGEEGIYQGPRGVRFHLFPGSALKRRKPRWVMAAHIMETSRVFARRVAEIQPNWIESAAEHLIKREYLEPDWNEARGEVVARERVNLLGLILSADRLVNFGPIAPEAARLIFAREALVYQRLKDRPEWLRDNDAAIATAQRVEERLRTRDLVVKSEVLVDFYDRALPRQVSSAATLENFTRHAAADRASLRLTAEDLYARAPDAAALALYPERVRLGGLEIAVDYVFAPGESGDGASLGLPLLALPGLTQSAIDAAVPGFATPRVEALLRSLPKDARRRLIPIGEAAARWVSANAAAPLDLPRLRKWLQQHYGVPEPQLRFDPGAVPSFLIPQIVVRDEAAEIARGTRLAPLRRETAMRARLPLQARAEVDHPGPWQRFELDELPASLDLPVGLGDITVYPALTRVGEALQVRFHWSGPEAQREHLEASTVLARRLLPRLARDLAAMVSSAAPLLLAASPYLRGAELIELLVQQAFRRACWPDGHAAFTRGNFDAALAAGRERAAPTLRDLTDRATAAFNEARATRRLIEAATHVTLRTLAEESLGHLRKLLGPRAAAWAAGDALEQVPRYVKAEARRWQRLATRGSEGVQIAQELKVWSERCAALEQGLSGEQRWLPEFDALCRAVEEYRISLYAQDLKTARPVSSARLAQSALAIEDWLRR